MNYETKEAVRRSITNAALALVKTINRTKDNGLSLDLHEIADEYDSRPLGWWGVNPRDPRKVFVAAEESMVIGVFSSKERAQAACDERAGSDAELGPWRRYDGKWERSYKHHTSRVLDMLYVTECEVES